MSNEPFLGLTMPVFSAFGWAGEEAAMTYALDQIEQFVVQMHQRMSREAQTLLPNRGLDRATQAGYLARSLDTAKDLYITFHLRPMALRIAMNLEERMALAKAVQAILKAHDSWYVALQELGDSWELRLQQMEYDAETNQAVHYKDLFKDRVTALTAEQSFELMERVSYLNGEEKWLVSVQLTTRLTSEFVSAMAVTVVSEMATLIDNTLPVIRFLTGGVSPRTVTAKRSTGRSSTKAATRMRSTSASDVADNKVEAFTYVAQLKPLHIRKGFINMTEAHWPFFAVNSRTETRKIILKYDGNVDKKCAVWRLLPTEIARLVLSDRAQVWLEDNFAAEDEVQLVATKREDDEIEIQLQLVR